MILDPIEIKRPGIDVRITLQVVVEDGVKVAGIYDLTGTIDLPYRAWLKAVREEVRDIESKARALGFDELRLQGRNWSRILPDFEQITDAPKLRNGLRKRLT
jgi:hypothetical protein